MGIEVLFTYRGHRSVINANRNRICKEVEQHLEISKACTSCARVVLNTITSDDLSGSSSGLDIYFLQRWSSTWDTYINVKDINEVQDRDWVTVTKELSEMSLSANNHTDEAGAPQSQVTKSASTSSKKPSTSQRSISVTVALLDNFRCDVPRGPIRKKMEEEGKFKRIRVARSDPDTVVRDKILAAFKMKFQYYYLECVSLGSKLIQSKNQAFNGQDAADRRGCLYICKEPQQVPSKASTNSSATGSSGIGSKNDDDDDLPPPPFKIRKLQSPDKITDESEQPTEAIVITSDEESDEDQDTAKVDEDVCRICTIEHKDCVIQPCGHAGICTTCAKKIQESTKCCPFCRKVIASVQHIYL